MNRLEELLRKEMGEDYPYRKIEINGNIYKIHHSYFQLILKDIDFLNEWVNSNEGFFMDDGDIDALLDNTIKYLQERNQKETFQSINKMRKIHYDHNGVEIFEYKETVNELIKANTNLLKKVFKDLNSQFKTKKATMLLQMIDDFIKNPNDYFSESIKKTANNSLLEKYLQSKDLLPSSIKEYLQYFSK